MSLSTKSGEIIPGKTSSKKYYVDDKRHIIGVRSVGPIHNDELFTQYPEALSGTFHVNEQGHKRLYVNGSWYFCETLSNGLHSFRNEEVFQVGPFWIEEKDSTFSNLIDVINDLRTQIYELKYAPSKVSVLEKEFNSSITKIE